MLRRCHGCGKLIDGLWALVKLIGIELPVCLTCAHRIGTGLLREAEKARPVGRRP